MSLLNFLPNPSFSHTILPQSRHEKKSQNGPDNAIVIAYEPPEYGNRKNFVPRTTRDYGDGGAFPEIPVPQFPLGLGYEGQAARSSASVVPLSVDAAGSIDYKAVLGNKAPKHATPTSLARPPQAEAARNAEETRKALEQIMNGKIAATHPREATKTRAEEPTYVRFTPADSSVSGGAQQKIIRVQKAIADPLEPPKFRFRKQPARAPSPPMPVLHSPPRKLTRKEAAEWKIPPCVSNWKNIKGFTIPLDKRVAADGRGYESHTINSRFSSLSTALYEAENVARENVRLRGEQIKKIAQQKRKLKEQELEREARLVVKPLADSVDVRESREGPQMGDGGTESRADRADAERGAGADLGGAREGESYWDGKKDAERRHAESKPRYASFSEKNEREAKLEREKLRRERMRERRKELRLEERRKKRGFAEREKERSITERIALGEQVEAKDGVMYDTRLFNTESGIGGGFDEELSE